MGSVRAVIEVQVELHVVGVELGVHLRLRWWWAMFVDLGVKGDLDMGLWLGGSGVEDDDMDLLKVFEQGVQVVESEATTRVVPALGTVRECRGNVNTTYKLALPVKDVERIHDGITLDRRRLARTELVQAASH
jgi:hypothetical protein